MSLLKSIELDWQKKDEIDAGLKSVAWVDGSKLAGNDLEQTTLFNLNKNVVSTANVDNIWQLTIFENLSGQNVQLHASKLLINGDKVEILDDSQFDAIAKISSDFNDGHKNIVLSEYCQPEKPVVISIAQRMFVMSKSKKCVGKQKYFQCLS